MENVFVEGVLFLVMVLLVFGRVSDGALSLKSFVPVHSTVFVIEDYIGGSTTCDQNGLITALLKKKATTINIFDLQ